MYYIVELANGTQYKFDEEMMWQMDGKLSLPDSCVGFTIVRMAQSMNEGEPGNFQVIIGKDLSQWGVPGFVHNGNIYNNANKNIKLVDDYDALNYEFHSSHAIHDMLSR